MQNMSLNDLQLLPAPDGLTEEGRAYHEKLRRRHAELDLAEKPLVKEFSELGFEIQSVWDFVRFNSEDYTEALPLLVHHLHSDFPDPIMEGIARALGVKQAKFAWDKIKRAYISEKAGTQFKEGLAVALSIIADASRLDEVLELLFDDSHGPTRGHLIRAISKSRSDKARVAIEELAKIPDLERLCTAIIKRRAKAKARRNKST